MPRRKYKNLMPDHLINPTYEQFSCIARSMHDEDVEECVEEEQLISHEVPKGAFSVLDNHDMDVLWFGVPKPPNEHDWYGNIRFQIDLNTLMDFYKSSWKCYFIDRVDFYTSSISRLLITRKTSRIPDSAISLGRDFSTKDFPIFRDSNGNFFHATKVNGKPHNVEFVIDATKDVAEYLFENCDRIPVNHHRANTKRKDGKFIPSICHKYNKFGKTCPTDTSGKKTRSRIRELISGFFEFDTRNDSDDYDDDDDDYYVSDDYDDDDDDYYY